MLGHVEDDFIRDVLPSAAGHVIDDARTLIQHCFEMGVKAALGGLAVVRVDLQCCIHADRKALLGRLHCLSCAVGPRVAHHLHFAAKVLRRPRNQREVLVPVHQVPLSCCAPNDDSLHAVVYHPLKLLPIGSEVEGAIALERRLHSHHCPSRCRRFGQTVMLIKAGPDVQIPAACARCSDVPVQLRWAVMRPQAPRRRHGCEIGHRGCHIVRELVVYVRLQIWKGARKPMGFDLCEIFLGF
mmetsp:Transcript_21432/g.59511  ORF Transcript_21432/g.59511 Transcript_21432/m.59511 type:complete len:241 (-) Transcript_21432:54-776(-)